MSDHQSSFHSSLKWTFLMTWGDRAFGLVFTLLLAAILGPRDFGIVALALIYIALVQLFNEGGIQTAIVQREELEGDHLDSAFWMNLALCVLLAAVSFLLAGWWARPERRSGARGRGQGAVDPARDPGADDRAPRGLPAGDALQGAGDPRDGRRRRRRRARARPGAQRRGRLGARRPAARLRRDAARPALDARLLAPRLQLLARARARARRLLERRLPRQPRRLPQPAGGRASDGHLLRAGRRRALPARRPLHGQPARGDDAADRLRLAPVLLAAPERPGRRCGRPSPRACGRR